MGIKKAVGKKKSLKGLGGGSSGGSGVEMSAQRPKFVEKTPPCTNGCPNRNRIREALMAVSRAEAKHGSSEAGMEAAFHKFLETTPFPSVCGRVCPHPCEAGCNRKGKDGELAINMFERFIGDFGLSKKLAPKKLTEEKRAEKIAVVGAGPAGLSCAYQLARRGYPVTVFEALPRAGGMLRYGIPDYRLPPGVLDAEIQRIADMGVELKLGTAVGKDVSYERLRKDYRAVFVGIGAHKGLKMRVEGEDAGNVFSGTDFLRRVNTGEKVAVGGRVVVIGGGDTAIDAARVARRLGAESTILYRRTRDEMPAIAEEIEGALEEGVKIEFLAAPAAIRRDNGKATGMKCQRMRLGEPDASGRRRPVPIEGDTFDLDFTALIAAIGQEPDFAGLDNLREGKDWVKIDGKGKTKDDGVYSGGDDVNLALAVTAIYQGRVAADSIHELIAGEAAPKAPEMPVIKADRIKFDYHPEKKRAAAKHLAAGDRVGGLTVEITGTMTEAEAVEEAKRCLSCGLCFECGTCWSLCGDNAIIKPVIKGQPYRFKLEFCKGCSKCADACPCGYIDMQ